MRVQGEEYSRRLRGYSDYTIQLIMDIYNINREAAYKANDITTNSELSEKEVVKQLEELKRSYSEKTER